MNFTPFFCPCQLLWASLSLSFSTLYQSEPQGQILLSAGRKPGVSALSHPPQPHSSNHPGEGKAFSKSLGLRDSWSANNLPKKINIYTHTCIYIYIYVSICLYLLIPSGPSPKPFQLWKGFQGKIKTKTKQTQKLSTPSLRKTQTNQPTKNNNRKPNSTFFWTAVLLFQIQGGYCSRCLLRSCLRLLIYLVLKLFAVSYHWHLL